MIKAVLLLIATVLFFGCGTAKEMSTLHYFPPTQEEVEIMGAGQTIPDDAILIGNIIVGDTGFTPAKNCTYAKVIQEASVMAQQMGGNLVYVVSHKEPDDSSTCHRINANVYQVKK